MIARVWSAQAAPAHAPAYIDHLRTQVLPALHEIDGYCGATLLQREGEESVEIIVTTRWRSRDVIRGFAGDDVERAVVADEAAALLTQFDDRVRHYELVLQDDI